MVLHQSRGGLEGSQWILVWSVLRVRDCAWFAGCDGLDRLELLQDAEGEDVGSPDI